MQVFSIFCDGEQKNPFQFANREIDTLYAWIKRNPAKMMLVTNPEQLNQAVKEHKLASMIGVEGGHMIEDDLGKLDSLYQRGARYMTLTWNNNTSWATSAEYESGNQKGDEQFTEKRIERFWQTSCKKNERIRNDDRPEPYRRTNFLGCDKSVY